MKKLLYCAAALATVFFAGSCQRENLEPVAGGNTVTYTVQLPDAIGTKTIGDDISAVDQLIYEVYRIDENGTESFLYQMEETFDQTGTATVELELVNNQDFRVLFWAQVRNNGVYTTTSLKSVTLNQNLSANAENYAAFANQDVITYGENLVGRTIQLVRPVAQLNIATSAESLKLGEDVNHVDGQTTVSFKTTGVEVKGLSTTYNVATGNAGADKSTFTYSANMPYDADTNTADNLSETTIEVNGETYKYVSMNYLGFAQKGGDNVNVSYTIETNEVGTIANTINNVPVKANYRTNIIGNLITSMSDYTVTLDRNWGDAGASMELVVDGLVKNINGDYEVSNANGLAHAINKLFVLGGNFYLTESLYDLSGYAVNPPSVPAGVTLNIYGVAPVVTRSSAAPAFAGVTITGLPVVNNVPMLIEKVEGTASISGVTLPEEDACLISLNDGTVTISGCTVLVNGEESSDVAALIGENTENATVVNADIVEDLETLEKALQSGVEKITLTKPIAFTSDKVLDLEGKTVAGESSTTGKNYDMFDVRGCKLTVKNGTLTAEFKGANMGWSASTNIFNITAGGEVSLENVTAKNLGGSDMAFVAHLNNWGEATLNVENSTLESTYIAVRVFNSGYDMNNVTIKNSTLKGKYCFWVHNYKAAGDAEGTDATLNLDILNGTNKFEYTSKAPILYGFANPLYFDVDGSEILAPGLSYIKTKTTYAVSSAEGLVAMSNIAIKGGESVVLTADIDLAGVEFNGLNAFNPENNNTFDGQGHTVSNWTYTGKADDMGFIKNWVGTIKNLTIKNAVLRTGGRSAVIAAKPYGNIENCHVEDCNLQAGYWACGLITGMHNSGNMDNCTAKNSYIKSTGGTGAITGVLNETAGVRKYSNCKVEGCTINNEGDDPYAGAAIVGLINIDNTTVKFEACTLSDNTYKGTAKNDIYGYNAGDNTTVTVE